ncbi:hypothetical protein [Gilvimarinus sp. DA14]|uniref:hypothetical protein n=1 Tax=Gilvimarinus sp. DA14 TaxID=2956798 RepID=UPI0020B7F99C|nr:hypothetical protein [Gilvimarinus sp. DA14]UTF59212.1 hypothetical protein NHM04_12075 [Gilvimarinus sp. DA14]
MNAPREAKQFPELKHLSEDEQRALLKAAREDVFGPDVRLERWRGNIVNFALMFAVSAFFTAWLAPAMSLSRDSAALVMLLIILPAFFVLQHRRYRALLHKALQKRLTAHADTKKAP